MTASSESLHGCATDLARESDRDYPAQAGPHEPRRGDRPRFRGDRQGRSARAGAAAGAAHHGAADLGTHRRLIAATGSAVQVMRVLERLDPFREEEAKAA